MNLALTLSYVTSSATVLQLRLLEDPKECFFFHFPRQHALLLKTYLHNHPLLKSRSLSCPSVAEWYSTIAVLSSTPASQSLTFEPGHLSHWSKYIELIHCAQCSRVWTWWIIRTKNILYNLWPRCRAYNANSYNNNHFVSFDSNDLLNFSIEVFILNFCN